MKRVRRFLLLTGLLLLVALAVLYRVRGLEVAELDAAARAGASGDFVTLTDGVTHYQVTGPDSGPGVVLIHGFSVPYYIWDGTFEVLAAAGFRVLRYDQYGRGLSDRPDRVYDSALYDRQLLELLDTEFLAVDDAGHLPYLERPEVVNPRIVEFVGRDGMSPGGSVHTPSSNRLTYRSSPP